MTDLEIIRMCAKAMKIPLYYPFGKEAAFYRWTGTWSERDTSDDGGALKVYDPLHDDAQAMALVKKFDMAIGRALSPIKGWGAGIWSKDNHCTDYVICADLNRAICECCARMQLEKHKR